MIKDYRGSHLWLIGASSGIGLALARELSRRGARLALSARGEEALQALNRELGGGHAVFAVDVTDADRLARTARAIGASFPRIDSIVLLSGVYSPTLLDKLDTATAARIIEVNLGGAFNVLAAALPVLHAQGGGQIALTASVAGYRGLPAGQPYSASKAGVINLAESLRVEQGPRGIDVKLINPGFVRTPMTARNDFPMPMMIDPEEAAHAIAEGLRSRRFEIHFPRRFTWLMKLLRLLPAPLYFPLARRLLKR